MKTLTIGILAHVDAGKTTLSEAMLYRAGMLRAMGRVDHGDAFLDTDAQERERGITIFSKQAVLDLPGCRFILLDTPGHVDFSAEMERTLQILDYAILVISATDGVQGHTYTLWDLLRRYQVPAFLFVNKMDLPGLERAALLAQLRRELSPECMDFSDPDGMEQLALCDETLMERFLETGALPDTDIGALICARRAFPCYFGAALRDEGVDEFLRALARYAVPPKYPAEFAAQVYKIARDEKGVRLTFLKVLGGTLRVKDVLRGADWEEKCDQLRLYSGAKFTAVPAAESGSVVAVVGLTKTRAGEGLGAARDAEPPSLQPVLEYELRLPEGTDAQQAYGRLRVLEEEDPQLHLRWDARTRQIRVQLMGQVQQEILQKLIEARFGLRAEFDAGSVVYLETIAEPVEGVGHYEPLRHYAEVHLLLEPGEPGSGIQIDTMCSEDALSRNWQRLIFTHLLEKTYRGVLTGAPLTDVRITLVTGRAHPKHTEGGDFRQATYRAVRQGLMKAKSVLLEPWYAVRLDLPAECVGRAMSDLERMGGAFDPPEQGETMSTLRGSVPVAQFGDYAREFAAYTKGRGRLQLRPAGYRPCREQEAVAAASGYDPARDIDDPASSIFCTHGAGFEVKWNEVDSYAHLPLLNLRRADEPEPVAAPRKITRSVADGGAPELEKELLAIFERTYGAIRRRDILPMQALRSDDKRELIRALEPAEEFVLVDGYNILFAWDELKELAKSNLDAARHVLMNLLCNYQGYRGCAVILVFDAYKVPLNLGTVEKYHNIFVVYTKEAETADSYIERVTYELRGRRKVRVATSDNLEQLIILGHGAVRVSAKSFHDEVFGTNDEIRRILQENNRKNR